MFSTCHTLITLVDKINNSLNFGDVMLGIFIDLKRAFDTVNHSILLKKLYAYGIRGNIHLWFKSYLENRKQYVFIHKTKSDVKPVLCGIPQGSVLGPLLFLLYINDLPNATKNMTPILFADDTSLFINHKSIKHAIEIANRELQNLYTWLTANKLTLNTLKSHFMIFHRARIKESFPILLLNNTPLLQVKYTKFLGVVLDDKLTFTHHISYIKNKISKGMGMILKARKYINKKYLIWLYNTFIFPYMIYCCEIWGNARDVHLNPILKLQRKIIRIITFSKFTENIDTKFIELNILPFKKLVIQRIGLQMHRYSNNNLPSEIMNLFTRNEHVHSYNTRRKTDLRHPVGKHEYMYNTFTFMAVYIWNHIKNDSTISISVPYVTFKTTLKSYLFTKEFNFRLT